MCGALDRLLSRRSVKLGLETQSALLGHIPQRCQDFGPALYGTLAVRTGDEALISRSFSVCSIDLRMLATASQQQEAVDDEAWTTGEPPAFSTSKQIQFTRQAPAPHLFRKRECHGLIESVDMVFQ